MKFFLAIFTIALVAQVSFAASIERSKRDADDEPNSYLMLKDLTSSLQVAFETIIKEIPNTEEYSKYKHEFEEILKGFTTLDKEIACYDKMNGFLQAYSDMNRKANEDETDVGKKIIELISEQRSDFDLELYGRATATMEHPNSIERAEHC